METQNTEIKQNTKEINKEHKGKFKKFQKPKMQPGEGSRLEHVNEALQKLYKEFPKTFIEDGDCKPLKVGIIEDLKQHLDKLGVSISKVRAAIRMYTTRLRYLYSVKEGAYRIDLEGNNVDQVTAEHAAYAKTCFDEINNKRPAKKFVKPNGKGGKFNNGKRPFNKQGGTFNKKPNFKKRAPTVKAKASDLTIGREVFVSTNGKLVKGVVQEEPKQNAVKVNLENGSSISLLIDRVMIPLQKH